MPIILQSFQVNYKNNKQKQLNSKKQNGKKTAKQFKKTVKSKTVKKQQSCQEQQNWEKTKQTQFFFQTLKKNLFFTSQVGFPLSLEIFYINTR